MFAEAQNRTERIVDQGPARIYACSDPELARFLLRDKTLRRLCRLTDDRLLVVPASVDKPFREALRKSGFVVPPPASE